MAASEIQITIFVSRQPAVQNIYLTTSLTHSLLRLTSWGS